LLLGEHHVEVECPYAQFDGSAGAVELLCLIDVVVDVLELRVRSRCLLEVYAVLSVHVQASTLITANLGCSKYPRGCTLHYIGLRQPIQLELTLLIDEASSLLVWHLPDEVAWPDGRHLIELDTVMIIDEVHKAVGVLQVRLSIQILRLCCSS